MAEGTAVGDLLGCPGQTTGGYFRGFLDTDTCWILDRLGFPLAEVSEDGSAVLTKVEGSMASPSPCRPAANRYCTRLVPTCP